MATTIFKDIVSTKGTTYNVMVSFNENRELVNFNCFCRFMSWEFWSKKFQSLGTICRHILKVTAEENITLPKRFQTERNLKLYNQYREEANLPTIQWQ